LGDTTVVSSKSLLRSSVIIERALIVKRLAHRGLHWRHDHLNLEMLSRKAKIRLTSTRLKEIVMNTNKVIELGKVSEETKGGIGNAESLQFPLRGEG
jgi:hypothetical protein